jgi:FkbM family methyltransferase
MDNSKEEVSKKLDRNIALFPDVDFFGSISRKQRFLKHPLKSFSITFLAKGGRVLKFLPSAVTAKMFSGDLLRGPVASIAPVYLWGFFDGEELNLAKYIIATLGLDDVFIDGGAHVGFFSLLASGIAKESHAFEPTPETYAFLAGNTVGKKNIALVQKALWKENDTLEFNICGDDSSVFNTLLTPEVPAERKIKVLTTTLDDYCAGKGIVPKFIKLDTEGSEYEVLLGATKTLSSKPILSIEIRPWEEEKFKKITDLLAPLGYSSYSLERGVEVPSSGFPGNSYQNIIFR